MKKILISSAICLSIVGCKEKNITPETLNKIEIDNICGNLVHYLQVDLENGKIDSMVFSTYTWNINEIKQRNNE